ncbi:proline-rich protein HaeIII subfamily 1-like [Spodoptera litura]|uniref:Proline-rich protein HaeIII subfamily 1-like n=1 Tax=Spodoptera litura TaxID=69820 RepID=A0A9J7ED09_SPOLT|nr:proline-rich protein HaeIII subfamily 1-like [Spodoptera litura]
MFVNGERFITSQFERISLNIDRNMQPKADRPVGPKSEPPQLHLTPSGGAQKRNEVSPQPGSNPWLLKPQHEIPPTPPPQANPQPLEFFPQRIG